MKNIIMKKNRVELLVKMKKKENERWDIREEEMR